MKQRIVPVAIFVALIVFFVTVGCKEFNRYDDDQTIQSETLTTNKETTVSVPETEPVTEKNPVVETKPAEVKPVASQTVAEIKPAETNPAAETKTDKPAETTPVAETEDKNAPAAVPVVTPEEAERLNEDAKAYVIAEKEKREPFYRFYQDTKLETVCFQGTIRATSTIPDPEKNDYDNCLYALFVDIDALLSDVTTDTEIACEAIVNVPIMKKKSILQNNIFLPGDKVLCTCAEYDTMPQMIQEIQLSDDIQSFEHQQYYSIEINKIASFRKDGNRNFAKREITILPIQTLPKDEKAADLRKERIQNEIARIEDEIKKHGGSFEKWKEEYKVEGEKYRTLSKEGWNGWIEDSYFATGGSETGYKTKDFIDSILPYKLFLEKNNIDLVIVRIPSRDDFAARVLTSDMFLENPAWIEHYYECLKNDIEIVDPMPEMWNHRFDYPLFYYYYPGEGHPCEGTSLIAAKVLSSVLERYSFTKDESPISLCETCFETTNQIYYWPKGNEHFDPESNITFMQSVQNGKNIGGLLANTGHPLLFLSNSFFWHPQRSLGASVPAYTAYYLQTIPDWFYRSGSGNGLLRTLALNTDLLAFRKVVVMVGPPPLWAQKQPRLPPYLMEDNSTVLSLEKTINDFEREIIIHPNNLFTFSVNREKELEIMPVSKEKSNLPTTYSFELTVSPVSAKKECMIKFNYIKNSYVTVSVTDKNTKEIIEPGYALAAETRSGAFFVPIDSTSKTLIIEMTPAYSNTEFVLKNIELWYY